MIIIGEWKNEDQRTVKGDFFVLEMTTIIVCIVAV